MLKNSFFISSILFFSSSTFAMFCPNNFNQINVGDTVEQVKLQCGKPTTEKEVESKSNQPQEWNYYVQVSPRDQATLKTTIAFDKGKITNMSVNGIGVSSTSICAGNHIQVGDTQDKIKKSCGTPAFINEGTQTEPPVKILEYNYGNKTLIFQNGILTGSQ